MKNKSVRIRCICENPWLSVLPIVEGIHPLSKLTRRLCESGSVEHARDLCLVECVLSGVEAIPYVIYFRGRNLSRLEPQLRYAQSLLCCLQVQCESAESPKIKHQSAIPVLDIYLNILLEQRKIFLLNLDVSVRHLDVCGCSATVPEWNCD